jgi:hypothetical protein
MHLTGLTNKSTKDIVDITKKLGLLLELHPSFTPDIMINIIDSLKNKLNPAAIKKCKDKLVLECLFDDQFINSMAENTIDVLDNVLGNMMRTTKHGKVCKFYALSIDISRTLAFPASPSSPKVERFDDLYFEESFANDSCADGSCADGSCADGSCVDGSEERFANDSCADGSCVDGSCADGSCVDGSEERFANESCVDGSCVDGSQVEHFISSGFGFIDKYSHLYGAQALEREDFGVDIGNTKNIKNKKSMQDIAEIEKKIDQSKVIEGAASFVTKAVNSAASSNKAELMKSLSASNRLNISSAKSSSGGFTLTGIKQVVDIKSKTDATFVQKIANKITTDISNNMKDQISTSTKQLADSVQKAKEDNKTATNVGDAVVGVVDSLGKTAGGAVKDIVGGIKDLYSASIGNSTNDEKSEEMMKVLKEKYSLDQSFKQKNKKDVSSDFKSALSSENLAKCANEASAKNDFDIGKVDVKGDILISNIQQDALINDVMNCAFNQEVTNEIATKLVNSYDSMIQEMIENVDKKLSDTQIAKVQGDIYAAGVAGAGMLQAAGEAAGKTLESAGKGLESAGKGAAIAAEGAGKGLELAGKGAAVAAEGAGKAAAAVASSLTMPLIALAVIGIVGLAVYFLVFKKKSPIGQALESAITNAAAPAPAVIPQTGGLDLLEFVNQLSDTPVFRK